MRDLSLPQQLKLAQHFPQPSVRLNAALVRAAFVVARPEPAFSAIAKHRIGGVVQHLMPGVPLQQLQAVRIGVEERARALQLAARAARSHACGVQLRRQRQQQVPGVRVRAVQQLCGPVLRRGVELRARLVGVGIGRHARIVALACIRR